MTPAVSVVIATRDRAEHLARQLDALRAQTLADFEVIVVDDGSADATQALLATADGLDLHVIRHERAGGPARARNAGWHAARGALVAFTDDDCVATPGWLQAAVDAWGGNARRIVQGRTVPAGGVDVARMPFAYSIDISGPTPEMETCNIFYPRALLEAVGGFDETFDGPQGEDTDLGWRARAAGAEVAFAAAARAEHAILELGPLATLRRAWRWTPVVLPLARHPELRRERLIRGLFWNWTHYLLARALLGLPLLRRRWAWGVAWWLARPLLAYEMEKARRQGAPALAAFWLAHDVVETAAILRGAIRYRVPVL